MSIHSKEDFNSSHMPLGHQGLKAFGAFWAGWCPCSSILCSPFTAPPVLLVLSDLLASVPVRPGTMSYLAEYLIPACSRIEES